MSENIKSTCKKEKCPLWETYKEKCPYYIETVWINKENSQPNIFEDCSPKRAITMLMDIHNNIDGIKTYASQTRSALDKFIKDSTEFMNVQHLENKNNREIIAEYKKRTEILLESKNDV